MQPTIKGLTALAAGLLSAGAISAPLTVTSYDMRNGDTGSWVYWDKEYSGVGNTSLDAAPLSGGTGNLTDGVRAPSSWNTGVENSSGTGPWVGWFRGNGADPVIKFNFGGVVSINSITIHIDDTNTIGGVEEPQLIGVSSDGINFTNFLVPNLGGPGDVVVNPTVSGASVWVQLVHRDAWVFASEFEFDGQRGDAPLPGTLALLGIGVAGLAALRRRAR